MSIHTEQLKIPKGYYLHDEEAVIYAAGADVAKIPDKPVFHNTLRLEVTELGGLGYVDGATYPRKGFPEVGSIYAINIIKEVVKQSIKHLPLFYLRKDKILGSFNSVFDRTVGNYRVAPKALCPTARTMSNIIGTFLAEVGVKKQLANQVGYRLAHFWEYDDVYRYCTQDMATEADVQELVKNPKKEIERLLALWKERDLPGVYVKVERAVKPLLYVMWLPQVKRAIRKIAPHVKEMVFDEADFYWASLKYGYNYGGKPYEERIKDIVIPKLYTTVDNPLPEKESSDTLNLLNNNLEQTMYNYTDEEKKDIGERIDKATAYLKELNLIPTAQVMMENIGDDKFATKVIPYLQDTLYDASKKTA